MERRERLTELLRRKRRSLHKGQGLQIQLSSIKQTFIGFFDHQHSGKLAVQSLYSPSFYGLSHTYEYILLSILLPLPC